MNERDVIELMSSMEASFDGSSITITLVSASGSFIPPSMILSEVQSLIDDAYPSIPSGEAH